MEIGSTGAMQQMQMRKMDGTGMGQGNGAGKEMREMMQQLPESDRKAIQEQLQAMSQTQRQDMVSQMSQIDTANMAVEDITSSILDILNPKSQEKNSGGWSGSSFSMYA